MTPERNNLWQQIVSTDYQNATYTWKISFVGEKFNLMLAVRSGQPFLLQLHNL